MGNIEERVLPYIADVRISDARHIIEIDGPLHFVGETKRYDLKSSLKHRLLTKQGWDVHHIAWYDWPMEFYNRLHYMTALLRSRAPGTRFCEYQKLELSQVLEEPHPIVQIPSSSQKTTSAIEASRA